MTMPTMKPTAEQDDVVLYMDELRPRSNGLGASDVEINERPASATSIATAEASPHLLETDNVNNRRAEHHGDAEEIETDTQGRGREHYPGIDDGLLHEIDDEPTSMRPTSPHPRPSGFPSFGMFGGGGSPTPDMNVYQQKKTIAQGMMDLALISANANQFRYVLQSSGRHPYFYPSLAMIGLSLFLQVVVGIGLIWNSRYNVKLEDQMCKANRANNWTVIAIFLVTILNVFISSFGVVESSDAMFPSTGGT